MSKRDYYEVLGVARTATEVEIKSAYRKLAMKFHPDKNPGDHTAEDKFKEAAEAYAILAEPEKRAMYDRFGHAGVTSAPGGFDPSLFTGFEDILGNPATSSVSAISGGGRGVAVHSAADTCATTSISFEESARGVETTIQIPRRSCDACHGTGRPGSNRRRPQCRGQGQVRTQQGFFTVARTCPQCRGAGRIITKPCITCRGAGRVARERKIKVKIPPGIATGQQLRVQGEGEGGSAGGPPGDLFVAVQVQEHEFFRRDGVNLFCEIPVNFTTLALGGEIHVRTLDGKETVKIPEGTQTGTTLRLRGKGMPDVSGRGRGDLFATVQVLTPRKLSREQRHLLNELAKALPAEEFEPRAREDQQDERNLFDRVKDMFG